MNKYKYPPYKKKKRGKSKLKKKYYKPTVSKLENRFQFYILDPICEKYGLEYITQYRIQFKYFDFYIPKIHLIIEVDGDYFHAKERANKKLNEMQKRNIKNDKYKTKIAKEAGKNIIRFWEYDINNNKTSVMTRLDNKIKKCL